MNNLTEARLAQLQRLLEQRDAELEASIQRLRADMSAQAGEVGVDVRDSVDVGDARMMSELDTAHLARYERERLELRAARERMHSGRYGLCEECEEPIAFERLKAVPWARLCLKHEEAAEKADKAGR